MASHKELSLAAAADRDANEGRWNKFELRLHAAESHVNSFISGLKSTLEEMDDGLAGLQGKIDNNDLATGEIKTRLMTLRRLVERKLRVSSKMSLRRFKTCTRNMKGGLKQDISIWTHTQH